RVAVVGDAVLRHRSAVLLPRDLEVAHELRIRGIGDVVDRIGAAVRADVRVAGRRAAAAELVGEQDLLAVLADRGAVPEREVLVLDRGDHLRVDRVTDVDDRALARAGAGRETDLLVDGDVVAAGGAVGALGARVVTAVAA